MNELIALMELKRVFIGEIIKDEYRKSGLTIKELASALGCCRSTVNDIFKCKSADIDELVILSHLFKRNLLKEYHLPETCEATLPSDVKTNTDMYITIKIDVETLKKLIQINNIRLIDETGEQSR